VVFQGLPDGTWIVREWRIRMPSVAVAPDFTGGRQLVLVGIREVGGTVERVQDQLGQVVLEAQRATLAGAVFDSTGSTPLGGARVEVDGTGLSAMSEEDGSFRIPGLGDGVYAVRFTHPDAPAAGRLSGPVEVEVAVGDVTHVRLVAPPLSQILAEVCGEEERPEDSAVLAGTVRDSETGRPVPGATIRVLWTEYRFRGTSVARPGGGGNWQSILGIQEDGLQGQTDMDGRYLACTVPQDHPLQAEAESGDLTSGVVALRIPETDRLLIQDLEIVGTGTGGVAGRVVAWESGDPLPGAQVHLEGTGLQALTDPVGRFALEGAPLGRHVLEVNFLGRGGAADTVQIRPDRGLQVEVRLPLEAVELEGFTVEVLSAQERELRAEGFTGATIDRVSPERMDEIRDRVTNIVDVIRTMGSPRIRISEYSPQGLPLGFCARWTRRRPTISGQLNETGCQSMLLILDGRPLQEPMGGSGPPIPPSDLLLDLDPEEIESVRVLSPVQAEFRYGTAGQYGALVIETRKGGGLRP
jgi:hypothetical protein